MLRRQSTLILGLVLIGMLSFIYSTRALADLATTLYAPSDKAIDAELILVPNPAVSLSEAELELKMLDSRQVVQQRLIRLDAQPDQVVVQDGQLLVSLPDSENMTYIRQIIAHVGHVEFIDGGVERPPVGRVIRTGREAQAGPDIYQTLFSGQDVVTIVPPDLGTGQIFYQLSLAPPVAGRLTDFVETEPGRYLCVVVDKEVISCSKMYHWAENTLAILPNLSSGSLVSLSDLALFLESGPLPITLQVKQQYAP